ncbi:MAG: cytochrome P450 [Actinomycetota bacterium]
MTAPTQLPFIPAHPLDLPHNLAALQSSGPMHRVMTPGGDEAWYVTGYHLLRQLFDEPRLGRTHPTPETAARGSASVFLSPLGGFETEAQDHARARQLMTPHFAPRHLKTLSAMVDRVAAEAIDTLQEHGQPADLQEHVAEPVPIVVICELLGVPFEDREQFCAWVADVGSVSDRVRSETGLMELLNYGMGLVARKRTHPADDVISRLCATDGVDDFEVANISMQLLFAGHETTVVTIGLGALQLLSQRDQWQALVDHPERMPRAVEEILRAGQPGGLALPRWAKEDFEIEGVTITRGELVMLDITSANHDPAAFNDPLRIDIERKENMHVTFGYGPRYCVGAALARMELKAVFGQLVSKLPTLRLAVEPEQVGVRTDAIASGVDVLPVSW